MKVVVTKEMTFSSGRHHVIQTSQFPAYFAKRKMKERMILIIMQSIGKVQKNARKSTRRCASKTEETEETVEIVETVETVETIETVEAVETKETKETEDTETTEEIEDLKKCHLLTD